jgi:ABC-type sugar transport system substrate-binding protein
LPVPALQVLLQRTRYWADRFGLKYLGAVSAGSSTAASGGSTAMSAIIARYPSVNAVFTFYDAVAEGAATTQATRDHGKIMVLGLSGDPAAVTMIRQGRMFATCGAPYQQVGKQMAIAAYDAQTHQHLPLAKQVAIRSYEITKSNGRSAYTGG